MLVLVRTLRPAPPAAVKLIAHGTLMEYSSVDKAVALFTAARRTASQLNLMVCNSRERASDCYEQVTNLASTGPAGYRYAHNQLLTWPHVRPRSFSDITRLQRF